MLIRSQDRNTLTRFYAINIIPHIKTQYNCDIEPPEPIKDEKWVMYAIQSEHAHEMIGEYSTEAKAIKVLDMIQEAYTVQKSKLLWCEILRSGILSDVSAESLIDTWNVHTSSIAFDMPADEEVEA